MRVKCLARELTNEQRKGTDAPALFKPRYQVTIDKIYLVLGISFFVRSSVFGNCCLFTIQDDAGRPVSIPSVMVEITDDRISRFWLAKACDELGLTLWPQEFYKDFFHDRVTDGKQDELGIFKAVIGKLEAEFISEKNAS